MVAEKVRVYEIAKNLKLSNKEVMDLLEEKFNIKVKSHASTVDKDLADKLSAANIQTSTSNATSVANKSEIQEKSLKVTEKNKIQSTQKEEPKSIPQAEETLQQQKPDFRPSNNQDRSPQQRQDFRPSNNQDRSPQQRQDFRPSNNQDRFPQQRQDFRPSNNQDRSPQQRQDFRPSNNQDRSPQQRQDFRPSNNQDRFPQQRQDFRPSNNQDRSPQQRQDFRPSNNQAPQGNSDQPRNSFKGLKRDFRSADGQPQGDRPFQQGGNFQRPQFNRPQGDRAPQQNGGFQRPQFNRNQGDRPFQQGGGFPRPQFNRPSGDRPGGFQRPSSAPGTGGEAATDLQKNPIRRSSVVKKKENFKQEDKSHKKEEKFEQIKLQDKFKKKKKIEEPVEKEKITEVFIDKPLTVGELALKLDIYVGDVIKQLMLAGVLATMNQSVDVATAKAAAEGLGYTLLEIDNNEEALEEVAEEVIDHSKLKLRAPVVTIMGHVDHGKTTLLDSIRSIKHKIVNTEVGGITQSIGAYTVRVDNKKIVFIDTPGHEAFTAMRARGAQSTDIAVLVVAADDGIMPQTIEAINHAKAAKVPIIIAVNKIDKPDADPDKVLQQLTEYELIAEKWGGDTVCVPVSALQGTNLDELLEMILLVAEMQDLKADHHKKAEGVIIEAKLDKGKGAIATVLVQSGTLKIGDYCVAGTVCGKIRALINDEGKRLKQAGPSTPVEILGLSEVPQAGDKFEVVENDKTMKNITTERKDQDKASKLESIVPTQVRKEMISQEEDLSKDLNIIIKANTHGSAEAVTGALQQLTSKQIFVKIIHIGIGDITEADIMLASASNAIIIGFSVKEDQNTARIAANNNVDIRKYDIIYKILEDIERTMMGLLKPEFKTVDLGIAEVRQIFTLGKTTKIAGCYVTEGKIVRNKNAVILRNGKEIHSGVIDQLKRFKDDVKEVATGYECGISFSKFNDLEEGDIIKVSTTEEVERASLV